MHTYQIDLTLEVRAVNPKNARRLVRTVARQIANSRQRAVCPGSSGVVHAWMDLYPRQMPEPQATGLRDLVDDIDIARWESEGGAA